MPCNACPALLLNALPSPAHAHCAIKPLPAQHHTCIARIADMGNDVAAHRNKLIEKISSHAIMVAVVSAQSVVVSNGVTQSAGSVAGFTAEQVEEVRMVVRMFPIFLTTIFYWTIYSQVHSLAPPRLPSLWSSHQPAACLSCTRTSA